MDNENNMLDRLAKPIFEGMRQASENNRKDGKPEFREMTVTVSDDGSYSVLGRYRGVCGGENTHWTTPPMKREGGKSMRDEYLKLRSTNPAALGLAPKDAAKGPFLPGDTVRLKSGGPVMTVGIPYNNPGGALQCVFWCPETSSFVRDSFPPEVLKTAAVPRYER